MERKSLSLLVAVNRKVLDFSIHVIRFVSGDLGFLIRSLETLINKVFITMDLLMDLDLMMDFVMMDFVIQLKVVD